MEAPLHHSPVPTMPAPATPRQQQQDALAAAALQHAATAMAGREQCPRCASRDTKFCYYNNYNTAQPRHFCRACRRYWTLGGSLRNVPVGGSTRRKRPRPTRALAAAVATATASRAATTTTMMTTSSCGPFASSVAAPVLSGGLLNSLLLGSAPLLEGHLGLIGQAAGAGDYLAQLGIGAGPLPWPTATVSQEPSWNSGAGIFPPAAAAAPWQEELAAAAAPMHQHHGPPPLLL